MRHPLLPRIASFVLVLLLTATARAQVFIPDTLVRAWLNQSIPGIVDASGIMDTTHAGIAGCDTVYWNEMFANWWSDTIRIDLTGIEYLDALTVLGLNLYGMTIPPFRVTIDALPTGLSELAIRSTDRPMTMSLPVLRAPLRSLTLDCGSSTGGSVYIPAIQDSLDHLQLSGFEHFDLGPIEHVDWCTLEPAVSFLQGNGTLTLPTMSSSFLILDSWTGTPIDVNMHDAVIANLQIIGGTFIVASWPTGMHSLNVNGSMEGQLPSFPNTARWINIYSWGEFCLPYLHDEIQTVVAYGAYCLPNIPDSLGHCEGSFMNGGFQDTVLCSILNTDCPGIASAMAGRHAVDDNSNGLVDAGEPIFPWGRVLIQPMNALVPAGADGWWERGAQPGTYTIEPNSTYPYLVSSAPAQHSATFAALGEVDSTNHFAHTLLPGVNDLQVDAYAEPPRPGFDNNLTLSYRNFGTTTLPATLELSVDADQSFVSSSPAPTTLVGNSATWDLGTLPIGAHDQVLVTLHTDAAVPLGTPVQHTAVIDPVAGDTVPADNTTLWTDTVVGAYDPNDKLLDILAATPAEVQADAVTLTYTIRFQNTGTYPAERVLILDTLSDDLQWNSFELLSSSHPCQWYMVDGVLHFLFDPILLPDSGSSEPASHGFVRFRMRPSTQLNNGDQVDNIAHIVFDFNTPIVTPPATFRVDVSTAVEHPAAAAFTVVPNPTRDRLLISGLTGAATVRLLDLSGRLLRTLRVNAPALLDVGDLATGTYLLELRTPEAIGSVRFVKE